MAEIYELIFAAPWWLPVLLGLVALALLWTGARTQQDRLKWAGLAVVGVGVLVILLSRFVETDRELVERQTREFVTAVEEQDWPAVTTLLHPNASATVLGAELDLISPREQILIVIERAAVDYGLVSARIRSLHLEQTGSLITVNLEALTDQQATPYPLPSTWQLDWQQAPDGWFLHRITLIQIGQRGGDDVGRMVPRR